MQAIRPTHATRPGAQTWVWSTRGDRHVHLVPRADRAGLRRHARVALFDFGIPDDADPTDLDVIERHHPAAGLTIEREFLAAEQAGHGRPARGVRPRLRQPGHRRRRSGCIPLEPWIAARTDATPAARAPRLRGRRRRGRLRRLPRRRRPGRRPGAPVVEVIERRPGPVLAGRPDPRAAATAGWGGDGPPRPGRAGGRRPRAGHQLRRRHPDRGAGSCSPSSLNDATAACQDFYDRITDPAGPRLLHRAHEALDVAADTAERRFVGDGGWLWKRNPHSDPLEAATLAAWAAARNPAPAEAPFVMFA